MDVIFMNGLGLNGRMGRRAYGLFTLALIAAVYGLASIDAGETSARLINEPWTIMGRALDKWIQVGGPGSSVPDTLVSLAIAASAMWAVLVINVRRLRDIGQSPAWAALLIVSGVMIPVMIFLSFVPSDLEGQATQSARPSPAP